MKKFTTILVLLFVLSVSAFAEGEIPAGGKSCQQGQTCLTKGDVPTGGKSDSTIINTMIDYFKSIFG